MSTTTNTQSETPSDRYCMECRQVLPIGEFKAGPKRYLCKKHYNAKWHKAKMDKWEKRPEQKQTAIAWQVAYKDSKSVFQVKLNITPNQVLSLLQTCEVSPSTGVRLLPLDPKEPLSEKNYCLTSLDARKVMCRIWKRFHCESEYRKTLEHYKITIK